MNDIVRGRSFFRRSDSSTNRIDPPILTFMRSLRKQFEIAQMQTERTLNPIFEGYTLEKPYSDGRMYCDGLLVGRRLRNSKF
jgi:hypothetical protein